MRGSSSITSTRLGTRWGDATAATCAAIDVASFEVSVSAREVTNALTTDPRSGSGLATTATSITAGWVATAASTSTGLIRRPALTITSSARSTYRRAPPSSRTQTSPVRYHPSAATPLSGASR